MADLSLDDYIKNDFRSRKSQGKPWKNKGLQLSLKTNNKSVTHNSKSMSKKSPYNNNKNNSKQQQQQRQPVKQRLSIGNQNPNRLKQQVYNNRDKLTQRKPPLLQFDARLKLSSKSFKDAREKIRSNIIDARQKIQNSQPKKYVQDARKKIIMNHKLNLNNQNNPKVTIMGLGKPQSFKNSISGKMTTAGANIICTVNNRQQARLHSSSDINIGIKRTNDERSNIATYEPLRGPIIQLKNDHYREKIPALKSSIEYDYKNLNTSAYSPITSYTRHMSSPTSPAPLPHSSLSPTPWSLRLSQSTVPSSSMVRRDKYEVGSTPSKSSIPLDRDSLLKFPRQSREMGVVPSATKRMKPASNVDSHDQFSSDVLSNTPSGYRVLVTNLHPIVTQDDIIELFGAVGALKKAHLLKPGCAEVVYLSYNDAVAAVNKYHNRELDGQPMIVKLTTPAAPTAFSLHSSSAIPKSLGEPLKFRKDLTSGSGSSNPKLDAGTSARSGTTSQQSSSSSSSAVVDVNLIHKALFSNKGSSGAGAGGSSGGSIATSTQAASRPVTFTVKI
ncbi:polymerase delta-interacting protein 3-like isoform X3 [Argonauta hians]